MSISITEKQVTVYVTEDGKEFDTRRKALHHSRMEALCHYIYKFHEVSFNHEEMKEIIDKINEVYGVIK